MVEVTHISSRGKTIRAPEFARRLEQACDDSPHCPPLHQGRLRWIVDQFKAKFNHALTSESVRKWLNGEMRPQQAKADMLAQILSADAGWLYFGDSAPTPVQKKASNALASGIVNVVAGLIQMDGNSVAFPDADDKRAARDNIHIHAIIKGANYALHVAAGEADGDTFHFSVPANHDNVVVLGAIREGMEFAVLELSKDTLEAGERRRGQVEITLSKSEVAAAALDGFTKRLP